MMKHVYSVGQVNKYIKNMFAQDFMLHHISIKGEVSNCKYHSSGHIYFTMKDADGTINAIMFAGNRREGLKFQMKEGDRVDMYINDEFFEQRFDRYDFMHASTNLTVLYEDENIMLRDMKGGLLSHPDEREYNDSLLTRIKRYLYEKGEYNPSDENSFSPALINRIDRNTGGIVMAAKNAEALRIMNQKLKDREIKKFYLCVVHGILKEKDGTLHRWLTKDEKKNLV